MPLLKSTKAVGQSAVITRHFRWVRDYTAARMARTVNVEARESKRNAILDATEKLLASRGVEALSVQDVLDALDLSKGAFFHYFDSKAALLAALVERRSEALAAVLRAIVESSDGDALQKLLRYFAAIDEWKIANRRRALALARVWYSQGNAALRQWLYEAGMARTAPLLAALLAQGVRERVFRLTDPEFAARAVIALRQELGRAVVESLLAGKRGGRARVVSLTDAMHEAIERVLGVAPGTLARPGRAALARWFRSKPASRSKRRRAAPGA